MFFRNRQFAQEWVLAVLGVATVMLLLKHNPFTSDQRVPQVQRVMQECFEAESLVKYARGPEEFFVTTLAGDLFCHQASVAYSSLAPSGQELLPVNLRARWQEYTKDGLPVPRAPLEENMEILQKYQMIKPRLKQRRDADSNQAQKLVSALFLLAKIKTPGLDRGF